MKKEEDLGQVYGTTTVHKRTDPDTWDTIYVTSRGGIFVLKADKK